MTAPVKTSYPVAITAAILAGAASLSILIAPPFGWTGPESHSAALAVLAIGLWATGVLPEHVTALAFLLGAMLLSVAPATVVFSGFASGAFWLIFGGLVIGVAVKDTGLGLRITRWAAPRLDGGYPRIITGVVVIGITLGFLMPSSMGRVVLFMPIALSLAAHFGFRPGDPGHTGIVLAAALGSHVPTFAVLPANVPNMVFAGSVESIYGYVPLYGEYLLLHFPVLGLLKSLSIIWLILRLFPDKPRVTTVTQPLAPTSDAERKLALLLLFALLFWLSDFVHGISPAWIALSVSLILLLPRIGLVSGEQFNREINFAPLFFVAGILGMGAVVANSGIGSEIADLLMSALPLAYDKPMSNFLSLAAAALGTGIITTLPGVPAVLTPIAGRLAEVTGLPLETILMTQVIGFSTIIFPYQSPPLLVALQIAGVGIGPALRLCLALTAVTLLLLIPIDYLWWRYLNWL